MARLTEPHLAEPDLFLDIALVCGPYDAEPFTDEELRIGWQYHRDRLLNDPDAYHKYPGSRPWGWWQFEAGRPQHLTEYPRESEFEGTEEERQVAVDEYNREPLDWLAEHGHLTDAEIAAIEEASK